MATLKGMRVLSKQGVLKEHSSIILSVLRSLDLVAVAGAGLIASYWYGGSSWVLSDEHRLGIAFSLLATLFFFNRFALYRTWRGISLGVEIRAISGACALVFVTLMAAYAFSGTLAEFELKLLLAWFAIAWILLISFRVALRQVLRWVRTNGYNQRSVVLVGMSQRGAQIAEQIQHSAWAGLHVLGYFDDRSSNRSNINVNIQHLGGLKGLAEYIARNKVDQVWIVYPLKGEDRVKEALYELRHSTVDIRFALDIFAFNLCNHSVNEVAGIPILNLSGTPMRGVNTFLKAFEDRLLAFFILISISPIMLLIALGVKLSSPGPVFYRQERLSWNGEPFYMLKFRSMPTDSEDKSGPVWAIKGEQRATKFGAFLRRTSLDELPQFINVLKGDMSIVGPRPERPIFVEQFKDEVPQYMKKHLVKAGITGWAQVHGWRGDTDLNKRIEYDLYYIENWSLWLDLRIVFLTLFKGFVNRNAY